MNTLFVTAYTPGYIDLRIRWESSLVARDLDFIAHPYASTGDWVRNGQIKPEVMLMAMVCHEVRRPLCWVDVDAEVVDRPSRLDGFVADKVDVAVHRLHGKVTLSGTAWVNCTPGGLWLLAQWQDECRRHPVRWDQHSLEAAL